MRSEIAEALNVLGLPPEDLAPVRLMQYRPILHRILTTFTHYGALGRNKLWLWEGFKGETHAVPLSAPVGYRCLDRLIPADERVWLVVEDWNGDKRDGQYWLFEGRVATVRAVLEEVFPFEYYVVDKHYDWLLCETHHNVLIAVGQSMVDRLRQFEGTSPEGTAALSPES